MMGREVVFAVLFMLILFSSLVFIDNSFKITGNAAEASEPVQSCSDNDADNIFNQGTVTVIDSLGNPASSQDNCINSASVTEKTCTSPTSGQVTSTTYGCPLAQQIVAITLGGCTNGACASCASSNPNNPTQLDFLSSTVGVTKSVSSLSANPGPINTFTDSCSGNSLTKYYCGGGLTVLSETKDCASLGNYVCSNGACVIPTATCTPNWIIPSVVNSTSCVNESFVPYDQNNCGVSYTGSAAPSCDSNLNGVIGDEQKCLVSGGFDFATSSIGGSVIDPSSNYASLVGPQSVELWKTDSTTSFDWDFSSGTLDLCNVEIETQSVSDSAGYLIVKNAVGVSGKTLWFDKKSISSNSVCIRDLASVSLSQFSADCSASEEILVPCPGSVQGYTCNVVNSPVDNSLQFEVSFLSHSAVREFTSTTIPPSQMTNLTEDFEEEKECIPQWYCSWGSCQSDGLKYYTCTDLNSCGTDFGKPEKDGDSQDCGIHKKSLWIIIFAIILIILLILTLLYFIKKKKRGGNHHFAPSISNHRPPSNPPTHRLPPHPPSGVYRPRPVYPR